MKFSLVY